MHNHRIFKRKICFKYRYKHCQFIPIPSIVLFPQLIRHFFSRLQHAWSKNLNILANADNFLISEQTNGKSEARYHAERQNLFSIRKTVTFFIGHFIWLKWNSITNTSPIKAFSREFSHESLKRKIRPSIYLPVHTIMRRIPEEKRVRPF